MQSIQTARGLAQRERRVTAHPQRRRNVGIHVVLLALTASGAGCGDNVLASSRGPRVVPESPGFELTPLQQQLLMRPVSPEAAAGRPATRADLEKARSWFGPGELEAVLAIVNRSARARERDTLPHCLPLCEYATPDPERTDP